MQRKSLILLVCVLVLALGLDGKVRGQQAAPAGGDTAVGTAFTYQGQLQGASGPVSGSCDFQFSLWDALTSGVQVGTTQTKTGVAVSNGLFTVTLDFGADTFGGDARWLGIAVRCPAGSGAYVPLTPRQALTAAPYAVYSNSTGALRGYAVAPDQPPDNGQVLKWNASGWAPATDDENPYVRTVIVSPAGDEYANGQVLIDALNRISGATSTNPYLLKIEPGVYNLGTAFLQMKEYVDIEGSGEGVTIVTAAGSATNKGTVQGANNSELRFLTLQNTGGNTNAIAIYNQFTSPRLTHVTAIASEGSVNNIAVLSWGSSSTMTYLTAQAEGGNITNTGVSNHDSQTAMTHVTIYVAGGTFNYGIFNHNSTWERMMDGYVTARGGSQNFGVFNSDSEIFIQNSRISVGDGTMINIGVRNQTTSLGGKVQIDNSKITINSGSTGYAIYNDTGYETSVGASHLEGTVNTCMGACPVTCVGVYDASYTFYANTCP
ncbi:MAG: hypothetical protein ANABAC_1237 [Anaerolineae bacterium]|nr:MAG: hypothetical protein ANABAC_1237 [Anaerolineae bacterium]